MSSTGEPTPSMARQYGGLTRKYASDGGGGDELAACLPPDLRHLLSATTAATSPSHHHRQTTSQRLQHQHDLLRSSAATAAANSLVSPRPRGPPPAAFVVGLTGVRFPGQHCRAGPLRRRRGQEAVVVDVVVVVSRRHRHRLRVGRRPSDRCHRQTSVRSFRRRGRRHRPRPASLPQRRRQNDGHGKIARWRLRRKQSVVPLFNE